MTTTRRSVLIAMCGVVVLAMALSLACFAPQYAEAKNVKGTGVYDVDLERMCISADKSYKSGTFKVVGYPYKAVKTAKGTKWKSLSYDIYYFKANKKTKYYVWTQKGKKQVTFKQLVKKVSKWGSVGIFWASMKKGVAKKVYLAP